MREGEKQTQKNSVLRDNLWRGMTGCQRPGMDEEMGEQQN
jgi:hypothetical protein